MSSFGETLRTAREAKGLSCSQVAAQTHMLVQIVEEMEREDFHRIPAPIYGRGFVRLFADCVGLDPVPLVREFMDIYEGRRAPTVSIREVPTAPTPPQVQPTWHTPQTPQPEPVSVKPMPEPEPFVPPPEPTPVPVYQPGPEPAVQPEPEPVQKPPQVVRGLELFEQIPDRSFTDDMPLFTQPQAPVQRHEPPQIDPNSPFLPVYEEEESSAGARFKKGLSKVSGRIIKKVRGIPRRVWRMAALLLCLVLAILFIAWSITKLYKATSQPDETPPATLPPTSTGQSTGAEAVAPLTGPAKPAKTHKSPAKPVKLISTGQNVPNLIRD